MRGRCCLSRAASTILCLIFDPFGLYDEPEILPYAKPSVCPTGADVRQRFSQALEARGYVAERRRDGRGFTGLRLKRHDYTDNARYGG